MNRDRIEAALALTENENRRSVLAARADPAYARAWEEAEPLISVTVATMGRPRELLRRSLPSILAQRHRNLELIVVGDGAGPETAEAVASIEDERVSFTDLEPQVSWTDDGRKQWLVGGTRPRNAAVRMARGEWIVQFDDDDAMRPECLSALLELARRERAEAVYGRARFRWRIRHVDRGRYPPALGEFTWAAGMFHAGLRFFERELLAAELDVPGDWWLVERMLRAGVRFAMEDRILCDVYPSGRARPRASG